jgi:hypothetical protein
LTTFKAFRKGEMFEVRNQQGGLISWGSFESEDKDFTLLRQLMPAPRKPHWAFEIARYPRTQFALVRLPGVRGELPLFERALRESIEKMGNLSRADSGIFMMRHPDPQMRFEHRLFGTGFRYDAIVDLELTRIKSKGWKFLHFPHKYEQDHYARVHEAALDRFLMNPASEPELVVARVVRGRWTIQSREEFLEVLERMGSPHLNLLREVLGAKKLKNEGRPKPEPFIGL